MKKIMVTKFSILIVALSTSSWASTIVSPTTGKVWMDRNLGASQVCTSLDDEKCFGDYYQWGRMSDGHEKKDSNTTSIQSSNIPNVGHKKFILDREDWLTKIDEDGTIRSKNWNPCPANYRIPTKKELEAEISGITRISTQSDAFNKLKLPSAGVRIGKNGSFVGAVKGGAIWSSNVDDDKSNYIRYTKHGVSYKSTIRTDGLNVRCISSSIVKKPDIKVKKSVVLSSKSPSGIYTCKYDKAEKYNIEFFKIYSQNWDIKLKNSNKWHSKSVSEYGKNFILEKAILRNDLNYQVSNLRKQRNIVDKNEIYIVNINHNGADKKIKNPMMTFNYDSELDIININIISNKAVSVSCSNPKPIEKDDKILSVDNPINISECTITTSNEDYQIKGKTSLIDGTEVTTILHLRDKDKNILRSIERETYVMDEKISKSFTIKDISRYTHIDKNKIYYIDGEIRFENMQVNSKLIRAK